MTDTQRFFLSAAAGIIVFAAINAAYYFEGREPNKTLIGATAAIAAVGAWHFLRYRKKS
jgi:hypothetical protein